MDHAQVEQSLIEALAAGVVDRALLCRRIGCMDGDLGEAIRRLRWRGDIEFRRLELTPAAASRLEAVDEVELPAPPPPLTPPPASIDEPARSAVIRTRSPGDVIRRLAVEIDLADPKKALATMVHQWPEAARRLEALADAQGWHLYGLMARALAVGVEQIEQEMTTNA